jgi:hypothetical protein
MKKTIEDTLYWMAAHDASLFQIITGFMMVMAGLVITYYIGRSADYHCVRAGEKQIRCDMTQKLLGFQPLSVRRVNHIQRAELEELMDSDYHATYRVVFVTPNERVPLTRFSSSDYTQKAYLVHQVNDFIIRDQPPTLEVQEYIAWWIWLFFFGFTGLGVGMILVSWKKYLS